MRIGVQFCKRPLVVLWLLILQCSESKQKKWINWYEIENPFPKKHDRREQGAKAPPSCFKKESHKGLAWKYLKFDLKKV